MNSINPNKIVDIFLFDEIKSVPYDETFPFDGSTHAEEPKIVFIMDVDPRFQDPKRCVYFETYDEALSTYLSLIKKLNFISL